MTCALSTWRRFGQMRVLRGAGLELQSQKICKSFIFDDYLDQGRGDSRSRSAITRAGGQKKRLQALGKVLASSPNIMSVSQPCLSLSGIPQGTVEAFQSFAAFVGEGRRGVRRLRAAQAAPRSGGARAPKTRTTVRFAGTVGFSTDPPSRKPTLSITFFRTVAGKPVVLAGRRKPRLEFSHGSRRPAALSCATARLGTGPKVRGHEPVVP